MSTCTWCNAPHGMFDGVCYSCLANPGRNPMNPKAPQGIHHSTQTSVRNDRGDMKRWPVGPAIGIEGKWYRAPHASRLRPD